MPVIPGFPCGFDAAHNAHNPPSWHHPLAQKPAQEQEASMSWAPIEFRDEHNSRRRSVAWVCKHDRRLVVRHCGHPTALRPYYIEIEGRERVHDLGTFRLLEEAQLAAVKQGEREFD
jgi:hypothetical protein